jgi:carbonic anhydrase
VTVAATAAIATSLGMAQVPAGPEASLARLKSGNARFAADASARLPVTSARRTELAGGQAPYATVLTCADSRLPPEIIFNAGLGDLFVVRVAGQVTDQSVLASVEYATEHLHTPLLVVMGHESCGAVKSTIDAKGSMGPNLDYLIKSITPAVQRTSGGTEQERLKAAIFANIDEVVRTTLSQSAIVRHLADAKKLLVVGAYYELASGKVTFSQPLAERPGSPATPAHDASRAGH